MLYTKLLHTKAGFKRNHFIILIFL